MAKIALIIVDKLTATLNPTHIELIDESHLHKHHGNVAYDTETHFKLIISAAELSNKSRVEAHRLINSILAEELSNRVHALSIKII